MALTRPVTKTIISTTSFGQPVYDWIVANTPTAWTNVTFQNGWVNFGGTLQTVQYRKVGDIVYIRGLMKSGSISAVAFALPVGFRPPGGLYLAGTAYAGGAVSVFSVLFVEANGNCTASEGGTNNFSVNTMFSTI